jgi:hypothetical protein
MDAKTLRAALMAALRVTVSTSFIGCGAHTSTDGAGGPTPAGTSDRATSRPDDEHAPDGSDQGGKPGAPSEHSSAGATSHDPSAGATSSNATGGSSSGSATGGSASDGGSMNASAAGEGNQGGAGTEPPTPCEALAACLGTLEGMTFERGAPLPSAATQCCQLVIEGLSVPVEAAVCDPETRRALDARFMGSPVRSACCADPETWQHLACTPWGPAVPPELPLEALVAWELAA